MTHHLRHTLLLIATFLLALSAAAQSGNIRYVRVDGDNAKDGTSWATAKKDIQDAINDLVNNNMTGEVWVAAGTYYPTETTESTSSLYYKAFKIPAGITVRGGFDATAPEAAREDRVMDADKNFGAPGRTETLDGESANSGVYRNKTILCGDLNPAKKASLRWNEGRQQFDVAFYGNSYHVVWFAMNGFNPTTGRANPLASPAKLEGCVVEGGHANTRDVKSDHPHIGYGGGIYMVLNSFVYNCEVRNCDATRNGGGIYMDGGGVVRRTYVHHCQALGLGTEYGFGGGICQDGGMLTAKERPCVVAQSVVTNCVGRMGGGIAIMADQTVSGNKYCVVSNSTLVNNNTATVEGGGVYTYKGGGAASMTIVNNKCNGSGITQGGVLTGRAGGLFSYDASYVANTVMWGNECNANRDIQYANATSNLTGAEKTKFFHNALSNADITDWSAARKMNVISLESDNTHPSGEKTTKGFTLFKKPTTKTVGLDEVNAAGYFEDYRTDPVDGFDWSVYSESSLTFAGINIADLDTEDETPAPKGKSYDMQFGTFNARPTIGALISEKGDVEPAASVEYDGVTYDYAFFVDPTFIYAENNTGSNGANWTTPIRFLGNALDYIQAQREAGTYTDATKVAIFVKEGTVDNTRDASGDDRVRLTSLDVPSGVALFGSFDAELTDQNLTQRNVVKTPTLISASLMQRYEYNVAHLVTITDKSNVTMDGFKVSFANANSTKLTNDNRNGAAFTIQNSSDIHFRNLIVSNCYGDKGTVVYADNSTADFENCIFHNNSTETIDGGGLIYGTNASHLSFDHCNVLRSVGHVSYLDATTTNVWKNTMFYGNLKQAQDNTNNCDAYSVLAFDGPGVNPTNLTGERCMFDRKSYAEYDKGSFNLGAGIPDHSSYHQENSYPSGTSGVPAELYGVPTHYGLNYVYKSGLANGYPRMVNPTKNAGYSEEGDVTYYGRATSFEPHNDNPVVNMASFTDVHETWGTDIVGTLRDFGGLPDIGAIESARELYDASAENANTDGQVAYGSVIYVRDYNATGTNTQTYDRNVSGTEGHEVITYTPNANGKGLYVKDGETYRYLDGNSWLYAINGNAHYSGSETIEGPTTWYAVGTDGTPVFKGFKIRSGTRYLMLNGNNLATTTNVDQATVWTVSGVTTEGGMTAGTHSIGANGRYITITGGGTNRTLGTSGTAVNLTLAGSGNAYTIYYNNRYVRLSNTTLSASTTSTTWTFVGVTEAAPTVYHEEVYEHNAEQVTPSVAANEQFTATQKLHVYQSKDDVDKLIASGATLKTIRLGSNGGGNYAYTVDAAANVMKSTTTESSADQFVLISTGTEDKYFIYNTTRGKYVYYTATTQNAANAKTVLLDANIDGKNATWWVIKDNANDWLYIKPGSLARNADVSWNYFGGSGNELGLAATQWGDSRWKARAVSAYDVYKTTQHVSTNVIGLQYAVNNAHNAMQRVAVKRTMAVDEKYNGGTQHVTRTYYDFTPTNAQPEVEVYVGAGVYTQDLNPGEGFYIRNHVKVYGAFPANGSPGMNERHAQLSAGIKGATAEEVRPYETILQTNTAKPIAGGSGYKEANVLSHPRECQVTTADDSNVPQNRIVYEDCLWDGFTVRYGYFHGVTGSGGGRRWSGAGVALYENVTLRNFVVRDNLLEKGSGRAAGIYCDGSNIENCYILDNESNCPNENFGGGIYMIQGTMFNTVIAGNKITSTANPRGAGIFIESAKFYNNTIVNNTGASAIGVYTASKASADLTMYNTIAIAATGQNVLQRASSGTPIEFVHCYLKTDQEDGDLKQAMTEENDNTDKPVVIRDNVTTDYATQNRPRNNKVFMNASITPLTGVTYTNSATLADKTPFILSYGDAVSQYNYLIDNEKSAEINCVNAGTEVFNKVDLVLPDHDMDWDDRIQDCRVDIGAYEYNGATGIIPDVASVPGQAIYYVTPEGYGTTNAHDPENAACAAKLQRVIDAAGRYKIANPTKQVIVKVANSYNLYNAIVKENQDANKKPGDAGYKEPTSFTYYATRTSDQTSTDTRLWSTIIPRGVEVWGGYTDLPVNADWEKTGEKTDWTNTNNGFVLSDGKTDHRNITKNPTYFDSYFYNKEMKINATTYHVVTFTERIYDINGNPYLKDDFTAGRLSALSSYDGSQHDENDFLHMKDYVSGNVMATKVDGKYVSNRAVLDGIFVTGGNANGKSISGSSNLNSNGYGGAAIVTDYAYVRNCIVMNNSATNGGGLALTHEALVSGSLIIENNADNMGGGLYVFEEGSTLSNGIEVKSLLQDTDPASATMDYHMAHVITSTIVANSARQGGGVWYTNELNANVRFNSVAIWQNEATDQANVYGMVNPEQPTDDETPSEEFYPFSYSVIQNVRASGTNNQSVQPLNNQGIRFVKEANDVGQAGVKQYIMAEEVNNSDVAVKFSDFGYFGLTTYSVMCNTGMPKTLYEQLKEHIAIADDDILRTPRTTPNNAFIEIGARALAKQLPNKQLMLRLFVANPEDVNTDEAGRFMQMGFEAGSGTAEEYYGQEGSSFAYPFNFLQDALDYVKDARDGKIFVGNYDAQHLPFEILIGKGYYYPSKDLNGETNSVWSHTFAIPEGVTLIGGFNPRGGGSTYYGRYNRPAADFDTRKGSTTYNIYDNVEPIPTGTQAASGTGKREIGRGYKSGDETVTLPAVGTKASENVTFQQWNIQDIADRRAMNDNNRNGIVEPWEFANPTVISGNAVNGETDGVYHIMTAVSDEDAVGRMPKAHYLTDPAKFTGHTAARNGDPSGETGYQSIEEGQTIRLNGLVITGGNALTYLSTALDEYGKYIFYQGAGLQVDGNRYKNHANDGLTGPAVFHNSAAYGVGYRDIPVSIVNCQFRNNKAGYGGAISSNGTLDIFASSFEQNLAIAQTETPEDGDDWFTMVNGIKEPVSKVMYPGQGGAILATDQLTCVNTLFANNEARLGEDEEQTIERVVHPTFRVPDGGTNSVRAAGGAIMMGSAGYHHIVNCDFVRNKANAYPAVFTMNPTHLESFTDKVNTPDYSQIINTVAWGNEVNKISDNESYLAASKLLVNIGRKDRTTDYIADKGASDFYNPTFNATNVPSETDLLTTDAVTYGPWQESVWFSAYEDGTGFTPNNANDLRDLIQYSPEYFAPLLVMSVNGGNYQNCNVQIVADNDDVAGPNFGYPSYRAGYDGFMEGADWSPARFNRLTDQGNGWIRQTVETTADDYVITFHNDEGYLIDGVLANGTNFQGAYSMTHYLADLAGVFPEYKLWMAIGNEKYMQATNDTEKDEIFINNTSLGHPQRNVPRISPDPTLGVTKAYIDIGVYEYIMQPLLKPGNEVDILWVSTKEHPENGPATGATWSTPTSDLQRAINTLLTSRNGHKKEIRIMEGEYTPVTPQTIDGNKYHAFVIDTKSLNEAVITPSTFNDGTNNEQFYAQSLTIKGGYSSELMYEYDPSQYKTVIRQNNTNDGVSPDYLLYIADPTMRYAYGIENYKEANNYGAIVGVTGEASTARTMPIQVDGVTLINDRSTADTQGSAIYYPDQATITEAHSISVGGKVIYYPTKTDLDNKTNAVDFETEFAEITTTGAQTISDPAKIVITKTEVIGSGKPDDVNTGSAVYIGQKGGSALIYNSVFHSNYGKPLDAYNTVNVNNTFGLNAGFVQLRDDAGIGVKSQMHNSALWKNNPTSPTTYGDQIRINGAMPTLTGTQTTFTYNSFTGGNTTATDYSAPSGTIASNNYNTGLSDENRDLAAGPNFIDPDNADIEARNFDIKPSLRLLNRGNDTSLEAIGEPDVNKGNYYTCVVKQKYDYSLASTTDHDVLFRDRINMTHIDLGAYEFQGSLLNPLYVDPNKSHSNAATGENWDNAFGYGDIQNAMDLAALYHINQPTEEAYVFVKGASATNRDLHTDETLTIRDGVTVYGSIISSYSDWHGVKKVDGVTPKYGDGGSNSETINAFIADMASIREGIASYMSSKTVVTGIKTSASTVFDATHGTPALIDGFVVSPINESVEYTSPVVDVTNPSANAAIALRNIIVSDNTMSGATDVAQVSNGLLYEALFHDNTTAGAALRVSDRGYAVNVTVEGKTIGADGTMPVDGMKSATDPTDVESATHIFNSITNSVTPTAPTVPHAAGKGAPYGAITNKHISGYFYNIGDANLNYQLTETSKYIDQCVVDEASTDGQKHPGFLPANLQQFVTYRTDRDLLGNPRVLAGVTDGQTINEQFCLLDRGAFETWKVKNTGNKFICGDNGTIGGNTNYSATTYDLIKRHYYPHDGSVCYIMEGQSLVIDAPDPAHEVKPTPHNPGYMLVKEGANFYGNGRPATCSYVAVERTVHRGGSIVSMPYAINYDDGTTLPQYNTEGRLTRLLPDVTDALYDYDSSSRSAWDYIFQPEATGCWREYSATRRGTESTPANHGVLYEPIEDLYDSNAAIYNSTTALFDGDDTMVTLRFTAKGASLTDYVYTEDSPSKTVVLTQYDDIESTGGAADFTTKEDMGWNCFGLPYLVSDYHPYDIVRTDDGKTQSALAPTDGQAYRMDIPHTLWLYYDGLTNGNRILVNGDGGYYSVNAWETASDDNEAQQNWHVATPDEARIWVGEGIFTQTAATAATETLTFYLPDSASIHVAPSPRRNARNYYGAISYDSDNDSDSDSTFAPALLRTEYYNAAGQRIARPDTIGVTIVREVYSDGTVRTLKTR